MDFNEGIIITAVTTRAEKKVINGWIIGFCTFMIQAVGGNNFSQSCSQHFSTTRVLR